MCMLCRRTVAVFSRRRNLRDGVAAGIFKGRAPVGADGMLVKFAPPPIKPVRNEWDDLRVIAFKTYVWSIALYGRETRTINEIERKSSEPFEM